MKREIDRKIVVFNMPDTKKYQAFEELLVSL